jgi:uncharacterized protein RhaS with RHS repeats
MKIEPEYDYRNRVYSATLGRFLQTDPIRFEAGDGNLYRYVTNNPAQWRDAEGLAPEETYNDKLNKGDLDNRLDKLEKQFDDNLNFLEEKLNDPNLTDEQRKRYEEQKKKIEERQNKL